jgi:hypothetical protein
MAVHTVKKLAGGLVAVTATSTLYTVPALTTASITSFRISGSYTGTSTSFQILAGGAVIFEFGNLGAVAFTFPFSDADVTSIGTVTTKGTFELLVPFSTATAISNVQKFNSLMLSAGDTIQAIETGTGTINLSYNISGIEIV